MYCKKVIRGERCDYLRQVIRQAEREICFSDMPFDALLRIGMSDDYPSSHYVFEALGHQISIADERLGEALAGDETDRPRPQVQARIINRRPVCTPFHTGRLLALCELWQELLLYL